MGPRYQCILLGDRWSWRLLGSNHRELARACETFESRDLAAEDALAVARIARTAPMDISVAADTSWHWVLLVDGQPRVMSSVHYGRRLECLRAVARFRDCAPLAVVSPTPLIRGRTPRLAQRQSSRDLPLDLRPEAQGRPATWPPPTRP